jgi:uncharacterized membrane protein YhaH (DUF805 family)
MKKLFRWYKERYLAIRGRIGRGHYLVYALSLVALWFLAEFIYQLLLEGGEALYAVLTGGRDFWVSEVALVFGLVLASMLWAVAVVAIVGQLTLTVRRLHDLNLSGWWVAPYSVCVTIANRAGRNYEGTGQEEPVPLLIFQLVVGLLVILAFAIPGSRGENRFGPPSPAFDWRLRRREISRAE